MQKRLIVFAVFLLGCFFIGWSQPPGTDNQTMTGDIDLNLGNLEKPAIETPAPSNPVDTKGVQYEEKDIMVKTDYQPLPIKAPAPPKVEMPPLFNNMISAGFGRFASPYASLFLNSGRNLDANIGLDFTHLSSSREYVDYSNFRDDFGGIKAEYFANDHVLKGNFRLQNTQYFYFADTLVEGHPEWKDSIRQAFTRMEFEALLGKKAQSGEGVNYHVPLTFHSYFDHHRKTDKGRDLHVGIRPELDWKITEQFGAAIRSNFMFSNSEFDSLEQSRFFLDLTPMVTFKMENIQIEAGLKINSLSDTNTHFAAYPLLTGRYELFPGKMFLTAGLTGETHYLRYYDLVAQNRYLDRNLDIRPMRDRLNIHVGMGGQLAKFLSYDVRFYTRKIKDQLIFFNPYGGSEFQMLYDSNFVQTGLKASIIFNKDNKIRAGISGDFRRFRTSNIAHNFNMPGVQMDIWANYNFANKVLVGTEVYFFGNRIMSLDTAGAPIEQGMTADVNLRAEYRFSERISVFLQLNNLLGNNWQRWYGYRERPFDVKGGATFSF